MKLVSVGSGKTSMAIQMKRGWASSRPGEESIEMSEGTLRFTFLTLMLPPGSNVLYPQRWGWPATDVTAAPSDI